MFRSRKSTTGDNDSHNPPGKESIATPDIRTQTAGEEPVQKTVRVAVMPPRLPPGMAPPTGIGGADVFSWDESINWSHNQKTSTEDPKRKKSLFEKVGLSAERKKRNPDTPNFTFREVPYDTWRKHYAKDKDGNYRGTLAPAEDCILNPTDLARWRLESPESNAGKFTRGQQVLPVYGQVEQDSAVPTYTITNQVEEDGSDARIGKPGSLPADPPMYQQQKSTFTADGKTAEEIIHEAGNRPEVHRTTKEKAKDLLRDAAAGTVGGSRQRGPV